MEGTEDSRFYILDFTLGPVHILLLNITQNALLKMVSVVVNLFWKFCLFSVHDEN